jgi:hypothetical protein
VWNGHVLTKRIRRDKGRRRRRNAEWWGADDPVRTEISQSLTHGHDIVYPAVKKVVAAPAEDPHIEAVLMSGEYGAQFGFRYVEVCGETSASTKLLAAGFKELLAVFAQMNAAGGPGAPLDGRYGVQRLAYSESPLETLTQVAAFLRFMEVVKLEKHLVEAARACLTGMIDVCNETPPHLVQGRGQSFFEWTWLVVVEAGEKGKLEQATFARLTQALRSTIVIDVSTVPAARPLAGGWGQQTWTGGAGGSHMAQPMLLGPGPFSGFSNAQPPTLPLAGFFPSFFPSTPTGFPPSLQPPPFHQGPSPVQPFPQGFFPAQSPQDPSTAMPFSQDYFHAQSSQGLYPAPPTLTQSGYPSSAPFRPTSQRGFFGPSMCAPDAASSSYSSSVPSVGQWGAPSQMDMDTPIAVVRREKRRSRTPPRRSPREGRRTRRGESRSRSRSPRRGGAPDREERCDIIVPELHLRDATGCLDDVLSGRDWYSGRLY